MGRIDGQIVSTTSRNAPAPGSEGPSLLSDLTLEVTMAMGNCPKYLHVRELVAEEHAPSAPPIKVGVPRMCFVRYVEVGLRLGRELEPGEFCVRMYATGP